MAVLGAATVVDLLTVDTASATGRLTLVLIASAAVVLLGATVFGAEAATRRERLVVGQPPAAPGPDELQRRLGELRFLISRGRRDLQELRERLAAGDTPQPRITDARSVTGDDPFAYLAHELWNAQSEAWNFVLSAASTPDGGGSTQPIEVFVNLARRMQTLAHRAIQGLDELENQVEDPDLLKGLFRVDHLSTRMRRQAESLAVIGGAASRRQWSRPVTMYEVLRSAIAEVEHYNRVKIAPPVEGTLEGTAVADVIHLLAELVENATKFAPPNTQVILRAEPVTAGLAVEIEDRGLGIPRETQRRLNDLLSDLDRIDTDELLQDGRIGLLVVSALARRHNVIVRLQTNLYGGTQAVVVIPKELTGSEHEEADHRQESPRAVAEPVAEPVAALSAVGPGALSPSATLAGSGYAPLHASAPGDPVSTGPGEPPAGSVWRDHSAPPSARRTEPPANAGARPELPRRHAQANLAPELLNTPTPPTDDADTGHNPGLMAAFQKGMRSGQEEDPEDETGSPADGTSRI
jgi:signal transduction histidine kinase